ncbi:MAG: hypothetical protein ACREQV_12700, partial [Candidatus Binatia bacterium]
MKQLAKTHRRGRANLYDNKTSPGFVSRPQPRRFKVKDLPQIRSGALLQVAPAGDRILLAHGRTVDTYAIVEADDSVVARRIGQANLTATIRELMIGPDGAVFAVTGRECGDAEIVRIDQDRSVVLRTLQTPPSAAVVTRNYVVLSVPAENLSAPNRVALHRRDGRLAWSEPIGSARV